ncbi:hypothetical protein Acr_00g0058490 [Actinidia rufa]|uniref:Uncharacterized protein n=1 Tax=Actinidia rufa TaxID=165716 RepID=A0A7J0DMV1_9ERIC|nr:hypothetical protein Acr_00g0058490 [Actinidia rufa]
MYSLCCDNEAFDELAKLEFSFFSHNRLLQRRGVPHLRSALYCAHDSLEPLDSEVGCASEAADRDAVVPPEIDVYSARTGAWRNISNVGLWYWVRHRTPQSVERLVGFRKNGDILILADRGQLISYDTEAASSTELGIGGTTGYRCRFKLESYTESLGLQWSQVHSEQNIAEGAKKKKRKAKNSLYLIDLEAHLSYAILKRRSLVEWRMKKTNAVFQDCTGVEDHDKEVSW